MSEIDPPGTCHKVGCPGKGTHPPHGVNIGTGTWKDYQPEAEGQDRCLGYPTLEARHGVIHVVCSVVGARGWHRLEAQVDPKRMGELVDLHKALCPNRLATVTAVRV